MAGDIKRSATAASDATTVPGKVAVSAASVPEHLVTPKSHVRANPSPPSVPKTSAKLNPNIQSVALFGDTTSGSGGKHGQCVRKKGLRKVGLKKSAKKSKGKKGGKKTPKATPSPQTGTPPSHPGTVASPPQNPCQGGSPVIPVPSSQGTGTTPQQVKPEAPETPLPKPPKEEDPLAPHNLLNRANTTDKISFDNLKDLVQESVRSCLGNANAGHGGEAQSEAPSKTTGSTVQKRGRDKTTHNRRMRFYRSLDSNLPVVFDFMNSFMFVDSALRLSISLG